MPRPAERAPRPQPARLGVIVDDDLVRLAEEPQLHTAVAPPNPLVVDVAVVARRFGITGTPTPEQTQAITDAISDAQSDVVGRLNRPIVPTIRTVAGVYPTFGYPLDSPEAWQHLERRYDDITRVLTYTEEPGGTFLVEVQVGLDGRGTPEIVRYITAHAIEMIRLNPAAPLGQRAVTSLSVEGQSISYEQRSQTVGVAGSLPTYDTIKHWRRLGVYQRPSPRRRPWPYL